MHFEIVSDYTTDAFLAALHRFISRGVCQTIYSDCGTNFIDADSALRNMFQAGTTESRHIGRVLAEKQIHWRFNPSAAPHFGGLREATVKSIKDHLRRVIGDAIFTYEEIATFLTQVEACFNSRPLRLMNDDFDDLAALTSEHFFVGSPLLAVPKPSRMDKSIRCEARWQHIQQMRSHF